MHFFRVPSVNLKYFVYHLFPQIALSTLQTKAETEIHKAQKLVSEKDAELHDAEESLSGLEEVFICHFAWLLSCAFVYLKTALLGFFFLFPFFISVSLMSMVIFSYYNHSEREIMLPFAVNLSPVSSSSLFLIVVSSKQINKYQTK